MEHSLIKSRAICKIVVLKAAFHDGLPLIISTSKADLKNIPYLIPLTDSHRAIKLWLIIARLGCLTPNALLDESVEAI